MAESSKRTGAFKAEGSIFAAARACDKPLKAEWAFGSKHRTTPESAIALMLRTRLGGHGWTPPGEEAHYRDIAQHTRFNTP